MSALQRFLDAAVLKPEMASAEVLDAIERSLAASVATVCVRPCDLPLAVRMCEGTLTGACVVLGFPHGSQLTASKADEARRYVELGAAEIDMVAALGAIRSHDWQLVTEDISAVVEVTRPAGIPLKVIFETGLLTPEEIRESTLCAIRAGADYVKTSTGFAGSGATTDAVQVMLDTAGGRIAVKASGGIRTRGEAEAFLRMGVKRLGVGFSALPALLEGAVEPNASQGY